MAGAETRLAMGLQLVRDGHVTPARLFDLLAAHPAKLLGLEAGTLAAGQDADLILIDEGTPWPVDAKKMAAWAGTPPFHGMTGPRPPTNPGKGGLRLRVCPARSSNPFPSPTPCPVT